MQRIHSPCLRYHGWVEVLDGCRSWRFAWSAVLRCEKTSLVCFFNLLIMRVVHFASIILTSSLLTGLIASIGCISTVSGGSWNDPAIHHLFPRVQLGRVQLAQVRRTPVSWWPSVLDIERLLRVFFCVRLNCCAFRDFFLLYVYYKQNTRL